MTVRESTHAKRRSASPTHATTTPEVPARSLAPDVPASFAKDGPLPVVPNRQVEGLLLKDYRSVAERFVYPMFGGVVIWIETERIANRRVQQSDGRIAHSVSAEMGGRRCLRKILDETIEITEIGPYRAGEEPLEGLYDQARELHLKLQTSQVRDTIVWGIGAGESSAGATATCAETAIPTTSSCYADGNGPVYEHPSAPLLPEHWGACSPSPPTSYFLCPTSATGPFTSTCDASLSSIGAIKAAATSRLHYPCSTAKCPTACFYCSSPTTESPRSTALSSAVWKPKCSTAGTNSDYGTTSTSAA